MSFMWMRMRYPTAPGQDKDDKKDWEDWYDRDGWDSVGNQVGWIERNGRWRFRYPDGTYIRDSWGKISGVWYLFDGNGDMLTAGSSGAGSITIWIPAEP